MIETASSALSTPHSALRTFFIPASCELPPPAARLKGSRSSDRALPSETANQDRASHDQRRPDAIEHRRRAFGRHRERMPSENRGGGVLWHLAGAGRGWRG